MKTLIFDNTAAMNAPRATGVVHPLFSESLVEVFLRDEQLGVQCRVSCPMNARLDITDVRGAQASGKTCENIHICFEDKAYNDGTSGRALCALIEEFNFDMRAVFEAAKQERPNADGNGTEWRGATLYRSTEQGVRVFSPVATIAPLKAAPKKWTVGLVVRALLAGQVAELKCNGHFTDDYAYDADVNFGTGAISDSADFARSIIEAPSGWRASQDDDGRVHICCHSFNLNSFRFVLVPEKKPQTAQAVAA